MELPEQRKEEVRRRKKSEMIEQREQQSLFEKIDVYVHNSYAAVSWGKPPYPYVKELEELIRAGAEGGKRDPKDGEAMRRIGVKPDWPDICLMVPRVINGRYSGALFIEMKAPGEKPRPGQRRKHDALREKGYTVKVVYFADKKKIGGWQRILSYLEQPEPLQ